MKIFCRVCTIHFIDEFEATIKAPCNFWGDMGMGNLDIDLKKKLWDWMFSMPTDEIGIKSGLGIWIQMGANPIQEEDKFENIIPGYVVMSEEEKKLSQKEYIKNKQHQQPYQTAPKKEKERIVN